MPRIVGNSGIVKKKTGKNVLLSKVILEKNVGWLLAILLKPINNAQELKTNLTPALNVLGSKN